MKFANIHVSFNYIIQFKDDTFKKKFNGKNIMNPYKKSNTSKKITSIIKNIDLEKYKNKKYLDILI